MKKIVDCDFDALRKQTASAYNDLTNVFNQRMGVDNISFLSVEDIYDKIKRLKECIGTYLCLDDGKNIKPLDIPLIDFRPALFGDID